MEEKKNTKETVCPYAKKCGGCKYQGVPYPAQLKKKQNQIQNLLKKFGKTEPIIGMKNPYFYRNKVHAVFDIGKEILFPEFMRQIPTELFLLRSA